MTERRVRAIVCGLLLLALPTIVRAADLATARALYASASYEEALATLATIEAPDNIEPVNQMRALCLLALGRTREAEQSIERIVLHNPSYVIETADVSPKVVSLFRSVRQRTLPTVARSLYARAKTSYDDKRWDDATNEFTRMLAIVSDPDLVEQRESLTDLRQLGEGFLKLSEAELAVVASKAAAAPPVRVAATPSPASAPSAQAPAPVAAPPAASAASPQRPATGAPAPSATTTPAPRVEAPRTERPALTGANPTIYSPLNKDVVPPVELQRPMPRWSPLNRLVAQATFRGLIEIVIDERGAVETAVMAKPVTPMYDDLLLQSARNWRYTPAKKDGTAVRYRQVLEIVLRPSQ
jgi:tetratricopeptide (TPR) repeat protein